MTPITRSLATLPLVIVLTGLANAEDRFVSPVGNDANNGLTAQGEIFLSVNPLESQRAG